MNPAGITGRVVASFGRNHLVEDETGTSRLATRRGKRTDLAVGDRVQLSLDSAGQAVIEAVLPRTSVLMRSEAERDKTLAANIDQVAIVFAAQPPFNAHFVWRALLAAFGAGIGVLVVLNKRDLPDPDGAARFLEQLAGLGYDTVAVSARFSPHETSSLLLPRLQARSSLLIGQSGMGKSTILNLLVPDANARTREFSVRLNLGRQTTSAARRFPLPGGGALVDSPGFQSFGLRHVDTRIIVEGMPDIAARLGHCRFLDCRHLDEPGCVVREAVGGPDGIAPARYAFYRSVIEERHP